MITFRKSISALLLAATTVFGTAAYSSVIDFDFTGHNLSDRSAISYGVDGVSVTVRAGTFSNANLSDINYGSRRVDIDHNGLGADSFWDSDTIDGSFGNDVLVFSFSDSVSINTIGFSEVDGNDDFAFGTVTGNSFDRVVNFQDVLTSTDVSVFASDIERTGFVFGIGAIGFGDNFRITSLNVTSVPLPAAGLLLLAALSLTAGFGRRRNVAAVA